MVEDGLKDFEKIWAKVAFQNKRLLINNINSSWDCLVDSMNEFIITHKARSVNKVKVKAPVVKISPWDGAAASFFAWFGQTIKLLEKLEWDPIVEKSVLMESLPDLIKGRCDQFISADEIKSFIWRSYGTDAFLTRGMEEILKKTSRFEGMEEFISNTIPNILKIDSALESYSALGRFGRDDVNMRVWNTAMLGMVFNVLNTKTMTMVKEDLRGHDEALHRMGGWAYSSKCFDIIVHRLKRIEANKEIEILGEAPSEEQAEGSSGTRVYTKVVYVQGAGQETVRQCGFCAQTPGKDSNHWPFGKICDSTFMKQEDVITAIEALKLCPSCLLTHGTTGQCRDKLPNGKSTTCFKGCALGGKRLAYFACPHGRAEIKIKSAGCKIEQTITSVPLVEQWRWDEEVFQVQYDAGASSSLIWAETIKRVPRRDVRLGKRKRVAVAAYGAHLTEMVDIQEAELTYRGMKFPVMIIPNRLEGIDHVTVRVPKEWQFQMLGGTLSLKGDVDMLLGQSLGELYPDQTGKIGGFKIFRSNFTSGFMMFGATNKRSKVPNHLSIKELTGLEQMVKKESEVEMTLDHIVVKPEDNIILSDIQQFPNPSHVTTRVSMIHLMMIPSNQSQDITDTERLELDVRTDERGGGYVAVPFENENLTELNDIVTNDMSVAGVSQALLYMVVGKEPIRMYCSVQSQKLASVGSQANQWFRRTGCDKPDDRRRLVVNMHKRDVIFDDLVCHVGQGSTQPLDQDGVGEVYYNRQGDLRERRHMTHLECGDLNADVNMRDNLIGRVDQGSAQPLAHDEVDDKFFDCV